MIGSLAVGLLLASACGGDDDSGDAAAPDAAPQALDADLSAVPGSDGALDCPTRDGTSGDSVEIGIVSTAATRGLEAGASAEAAAAYANECLGGAGGRPIELVTCSSSADTPDDAATCAGELVDEGVDAAAVAISTQGDTLVPALTEVGIPYVTSSGSSAAESNDEDDLVFSLTSGSAGAMAAMAQYAANNDVAKVAIVVSDLAAPGIGQLANIPFAAAGVAFEIQGYAADDTDMGALVQGLSDDTEAVAILTEGAVCGAVVEAARSAVPDMELMTVATCLQAVGETVGPEVFDGAAMFGNFDPFSEHPEAVLYREVMAAYAPDTDPAGLTVAGYQVVLGLVRALAGVDGDIDRDSIADALRASIDVPLPAGAGATFGCSTTPIPIITASCSGDAIVFTLEGATPTSPEVLDIAPLFAF
ncbi:MAG: hypothetical protein S0880_15655 [Actinomycetota bacterium]|nr:hypothetical protein [Actinomycetota bacterium]